MQQRGIQNVIVMGVHTNMCVLGRPFSIRQMVYQGQNVVLMRDITDTMYNSRMRPYVRHTQGTELMIEHIEKYWCPTIASTGFAGESEFRFAEESKPHAVVMIGEREYKTDETLPRFVAQHLEPRGIRCTIIHADAADGNLFPGLKALKTADVLLLSVRRRVLPEKDLQLVREFLAAGKPVVGIRTANHAFHNWGQRPEGHAEWQEFDAQVIGGNYTGHHGDGPDAAIRAAEGANDHPILQDVSIDSLVGHGSLYKVSPLAKTATPLLIGRIPDQMPEPVAWTHNFGEARVFYTSLGHPDDFQSDEFCRLLANAVEWTLARAPTRSAAR
jgi:type 1 glutamine amidotransferase